MKRLNKVGLLNNTSLFIRSNAFSKSTKQANVDNRLFFLFRIILVRVKMWSMHARPGLNPFCSSAYILCVSHTFDIRLFNTLENSLYTVDNNVIPLYCIGIVGSVIDDLGTGLIIPTDQIVGIFSNENNN